MSCAPVSFCSFPVFAPQTDEQLSELGLTDRSPPPFVGTMDIRHPLFSLYKPFKTMPDNTPCKVIHTTLMVRTHCVVIGDGDARQLSFSRSHRSYVRSLLCSGCLLAPRPLREPLSPFGLVAHRFSTTHGARRPANVDVLDKSVERRSMRGALQTHDEGG
jgi:hypothetical protein